MIALIINSTKSRKMNFLIDRAVYHHHGISTMTIAIAVDNSKKLAANRFLSTHQELHAVTGAASGEG